MMCIGNEIMEGVFDDKCEGRKGLRYLFPNGKIKQTK